MSQPTRRDLCTAFAALAALGLPAEAQTSAEAGTLTQSEIFHFDQLPLTPNPHGGGMRRVFQGTLATGEFIEVHETTLFPGQMPHPAHRHTHSELILLREGKLFVTCGETSGTIEPGGIAFNASGIPHSAKNIGDIPANYFIVAIGIQKMLT